MCVCSYAAAQALASKGKLCRAIAKNGDRWPKYVKALHDPEEGEDDSCHTFELYCRELTRGPQQRYPASASEHGGHWLLNQS